MKEIWRIIKEFDNYCISNKGRVKNRKTKVLLKPLRPNKTSQLLYTYLSKKGKSTSRPIPVLVAKYFNKMKKKDNSAIHLNYVQFDNREPNIEGATKGQAIVRTRKANRLKAGKIKGIYKYPIGNRNWRAILSSSDGKMGTKLLGYYYTKEQAIKVYHAAYKDRFGTEPFKLEDHV